jgi:hypothetical protein
VVSLVCVSLLRETRNVALEHERPATAPTTV